MTQMSHHKKDKIGRIGHLKRAWVGIHFIYSRNKHRYDEDSFFSNYGSIDNFNA